MIYRIKEKDIEKYNKSAGVDFPKYTSQLINWANQNAQGTRPSVVGQMSELFPAFMASATEITVEAWEKWYTDEYPAAVGIATDKIYMQVENLKRAIVLIDRKMIENWVKDLIFLKTYNGMYVQEAVLAFLAERQGVPYRLASPAEEAKGIDGFVGGTPYSVKPDTYKTMGRLSEEIPVKMVYYTKAKTGLNIEVED